LASESVRASVRVLALESGSAWEMVSASMSETVKASELVWELVWMSGSGSASA
jgi:hypothetical protein